MIPFLLSIGYLMLNGSLGSTYYRLFNVRWYFPFPYYRLINVLWLPFLKIKNRIPSLKIKKFRVNSCSCFLIEMKFIFKLGCCLIMGNVAFSILHLHKNIFQYITILYIAISRFQNFKISKVQEVGYTHDPNIFENFESHLSKDNIFSKMFPYTF